VADEDLSWERSTQEPARWISFRLCTSNGTHQSEGLQRPQSFAWLEVCTEGIAAHGSRPREGVDAIRAMGKVLQELELLDERLQTGPAHALLGTGSLHASLIQGGREWSSYPDRCVLKYERRTVPTENDAVVEGELNAILSKLRQSDARFRGRGRFVFSRAPLEVDRGLPSMQRFFDTAQSCMPQQVEWGAASFWTDAALLSEAGIPAAVFGPRGEGLHSLEEYVIADDVVACAEIIYRFVMGNESMRSGSLKRRIVEIPLNAKTPTSHRERSPKGSEPETLADGQFSHCKTLRLGVLTVQI
jgi:hypothetical protein